MPHPDAPILLVDDDLPIRELLGEYLALRGLRVAAVSSGPEAVAYLDEKPVRLVLTDMRIPQPDGLALLRICRERAPPIPVILMTGYGTVESAVYALKLGASDFILKPFKLRVVYNAIRVALERSRTEREVPVVRQFLELYEQAQALREPSEFRSWLHRSRIHLHRAMRADASRLVVEGVPVPGLDPGDSLGPESDAELLDRIRGATQAVREDPQERATWPVRVLHPLPAPRGGPHRGMLGLGWSSVETMQPASVARLEPFCRLMGNVLDRAEALSPP